MPTRDAYFPHTIWDLFIELRTCLSTSILVTSRATRIKSVIKIMFMCALDKMMVINDYKTSSLKMIKKFSSSLIYMYIDCI